MADLDLNNCEWVVEPMQAMNPLFIPSVVAELLPYLCFEDIKTSRLVCRLWAEEGTKVLSSKGRFHLKGQVGIHNFLVHLRNSQSPSKLGSVKKFGIKLSPGADEMETKELLETVDSKKLMKEIGTKIISVVLDIQVWRWTREVLWQFLHSSVPNLESLVLSLRHAKDTVVSLGTYRLSSVSKLNRQKMLPNIRHLQFIYQDKHRNKDDVNLAPILAADLFSWMPNLKKFTCDGDKPLHEEILWAFFGIKDFHTFNPNFSAFDFDLVLNEGEVKEFHELLPYPLESLKLSLRPGLRFPALYSFISSLGSTLTSLQLDFIFIPLHPETFPCGRDLVNLKNLTLKNYNGPLNFIHHTGKLKKLMLTNVNLSVAFREEDQDICFDSPHGLTSLEVFDGHSNAGRFSFTHIFRKMVKLFPKLTTFRMDYLTDANIKIIADGFNNLEKLILDNSVCTDEGVTGFPSSRFKDLPTTTVANHDDTNRLPCIAGLKYLRTLHLNSPMISDRSLQFGVSLCKELKHLSLSSPMITGGELKVIAKTLNLYSLKLTSCYRVTETETLEIKKILPHGATISCSTT